jgi:hypothetical protein
LDLTPIHIDNGQILFAACASLLVREFSTYAKHSGIAEVKTVLGGFVIRRFLGAWTLVVKTLGLVSRSLPSRKLQLIVLVPGRGIWSLARQRRTSRACRLLLSEPVYETVPQYQQ